MSVIKKCYETIGSPEMFGHGSKQRIKCYTADLEVTLTAQANGLVVCSNWKKCSHHRQKGLNHCPELVGETVLKSMLRDQNKRRLVFLDR